MKKKKLLRKTEMSLVGLSRALTRTEMKRSRCHLVSYPCRHTLETETEGTTYITYDVEG